MELNAKKKYKLIEIETPGDPTTEVEEYESPYVVVGRVILKIIYKVFQFGLYLVITFLELLIKLLKAMFLRDFRPFGIVTEGKNNFLNNIARKEINREKIRFTADYMGRHEYTFPRSDTFLNSYKEIQERLKAVSEHNINLNNELYKDTIKQINCLIVESEKQALKQGYEYARETKYKLDTSTVYQDFIQDKVMQGESNRKFKEGE